MELELLKPVLRDPKLKGTIHTSGKLGFTLETINMLELEKGKSVQIYKEKSDRSNLVFYIRVLDHIAEDAYPVIKAGQYYYLNTAAFFDQLSLDYKNNYYTFFINKTTVNDSVYFKLDGKVKSRQKKKED